MSLRTAFALALFASLSAGCFSQAQAADYIAASPAVSDPVCQQQGVINSAVAQFSRLVHGVPDMPAVRIDAVSNVSATHFEPKTYPSGIERHYCRATAVLSNGENRNMWYMVENRQGFASIGRNVESCVDGFDTWFVYDGRCRVLR